MPFFLKFFEARLYRVLRKAVMDLKDLKNVLNAKGELIGFSGTFTKDEIRSFKFYGKSRNAARSSIKNSKGGGTNL